MRRSATRSRTTLAAARALADAAQSLLQRQDRGRFAPGDRRGGLHDVVLPSSSPANAMLSFDQKLRLRRDILT